jgi:hypothetical protein
MADYCTKCAEDLGFPVDIDPREIAKTLEPDTYLAVVCEGCGMRAVGLDPDYTIVVAMPVNDTDDTVFWVSLEEFERDFEEKYKYKEDPGLKA